MLYITNSLELKCSVDATNILFYSFLKNNCSTMSLKSKNK